MSERTIFIEALEQDSPERRSEFLDSACAGDMRLRQRVEALLESHEQAGGFLGRLATERLAEELGAGQTTDATEGSTDKGKHGSEELEFLTPTDKPGSLGRLGHYDIQEVIGRGGMGVVLRAFDERLHRVVAIKVMAAQLANNATARKRFTREAHMTAAVCHDHVVTIHAVEEALLPSPLGGEGPGVRGIPYIVMHYVAGMSLQERIERGGPLELHEILRIGMQTASGLAAAHAQGLIHRDIKPANILLENGVERVKITDFGLARAADDASLTQSGAVAGTPHYMAPEQARGDALDARTDLFSLGSVLYAMCTGRSPFRASGSMAVLKRVCEETPTPIRETNPEIPDWLIAIIDKLHAKDPAERFQSATEVADVLGRHLAHVQHPSLVPLAPWGRGTGGAGQPLPRPRHRYALAAAVLLCCLLGSLSLTEATGVTQLVSTVIRILTPEGTLVVEVDDPEVKVTIEGDGGIVINGAGLQQVRLKPGSYKVQAAKDGKPVPLERELVSIAKGGRETVRVKLEAPTEPAREKAAPGAFVILGSKDVAERKFDTLVEAVVGSGDGDTIEIRGNGPFMTKPIVIEGRSVTIRAGEGSWPVIRADPVEQATILIHGQDARLVLEGLEFHWLDSTAGPANSLRLVVSSGPAAALHAVNCRFLMNRRAGPHFMSCIGVWDSAMCQLRNCQLLVAGHGQFYGCFDGSVTPGSEMNIENCLIGQWMVLYLTDSEPRKVTLNRNTFVGSQSVTFQVSDGIVPPAAQQDSRPFEIVTSANILGGQINAVFVNKGREPSAQEIERALKRLVGWQDQGNLYSLSEGSDLFRLGRKNEPADIPLLLSTPPIRTLAAWNDFWALPGLASQRGQARYQGGDLVAKASTTPELLLPEDFRLRPDSAGYRAGPDGKDLGADVDLVGPGAAYERWKKTPEYQQWLKDTKQAKAETPQAETMAFVLLGGKDIAERKFDTLADAVQRTSGGDTIEIRGNGPFVSDGVTIRHPLVIRAGDGYAPSITLSQASADSNTPLLDNVASLVLEGLELRRVGGPPGLVGNRLPKLVNTWHGNEVHLANCRLILDTGVQRTGELIGGRGAQFNLRNCDLCGGPNYAAAWRYATGGRCRVENCLSAVGAIAFHQDDPIATDVEIRVRGNTLLGDCMSLVLWNKPNLQLDGKTAPPIGLDVSRNIVAPFPQKGLLFFHQFRLQEPYSPAEAEAHLPRLIQLAEQQNAYLNGVPILRIGADWKFLKGATRGQDLADWNRLWDQQNTGSVQGDVRFHGGDLIGRAQTMPDQLNPKDFRLRPDSVGYRAGPDGRDLGADVDLVGPGTAYERWKKTPEYQAWLNETGQMK